MKSSSPESAAVWTPADFNDPDATHTEDVAPVPWTPREFLPGEDIPHPEVHRTRRAPSPTAGETHVAPPGGYPDAPTEDPAQAYARGLAEGRREGSAEVEAELRPAVRALQGMVEAIQTARAQLLSDVEANLCVLALAAARNIVQREIEIDPTILRDLVVRGLAAIKPDSPIEVRLHPADLEAVQPLLDASARSADAEVHWVGDPALERGGFFLDGPRRLVDGRLDEALRHLYERMIYE